MPDSITWEVAEWIAGLRTSQIPGPVSEAVRLLAMDTVGAGLAGRDLPWTRAIAGWAMAAVPGRQENGRAHLWGHADAVLRASDAALVNGAAAHAFELDDFHNAKLHPGAVVVPAALAMGEALNASGDEVLTAIVAGYEVMIRTSLALGPAAARERGWHLTAVCGPFGAAAAGAVLLELDTEHTAWALGLAGTQSGGLFAFTADGSNSKRLHPGRAAQSGIMAAEMAALGLTGPTQIYEADDGGFLKTFVDRPESHRLTDDLGVQWRAAETNFKPYSCCGSLHAHVDAALQLRDDWRDNARVRVGLAGLVKQQCGYEYAPGSELNSQMSARYCIAAALLDGAVLPSQFTLERIADTRITELAQRIELVHDATQDALYPQNFCGWTEVETKTGEGRRIMVMHPSGSPENTKMATSLRQKFVALVSPLLGQDRTAALAEAFDAIGHRPVRQLLDAAAVPL
ncbi:MmgE/PrpD family protein [Pararoseomonas indoligenes]|uniref:MmgE/PrpD family protein n=1 Tax=Roseomonas indoligenes TaxID=2820811 RepID=A0A940SA25_9PROT|nr:MmgE/PrpD family protein [Pararoseomonas indoligenes]MBP0495747.1 MmgE/PrpD family protein [Pararoseomonas indoligenes]